ncbi:MAG TPA: VWA domain-containing protein [Thermoanaerobaculia bacterium]|nr:VWA domain-containing protein [Thermoanaerobaculia bacterium]
MSPFPRLALLSLILTFPAFAEPMPWHTVPATAAAVAGAQQKILLVHYRSACEKCNAELEGLLEQAAKDEVFTTALDSFLPLRITDGKAPAHPIADELSKRYKGPLIALYDAANVLLAVVDKPRSLDVITEEMLRVRAVRTLVAQSASLRLGGQEAAADFITGAALLNAKRFLRATERFDRAITGFRARGDEASVQVAQVHSAVARYALGEKTRARTMVSDVLRKPASPAAAAEAHVAYAGFHEEASQWAMRPVSVPKSRRRNDTVRRIDASSGVVRRELVNAVESYRKAYALAEPGSRASEAAKRALARLDDRPLPVIGGETPVLRIVAPARLTLTGDADFLVQAQEEIAKVELYLDDRKVASEEERPFRISIDVGPTPRVRTVKAVGFDAQGKSKGEGLLTINDRQDVFLVAVVAPSAATIAGAVDVELDVKVPPGRKLDRVAVSWNDRPVATLTAPPFRARLEVVAGEFGYLRAAGVLDDGTATEVTRLYNATGMSENVDVAAVTVIANVADAEGKRIAGLQSDDFAIEDQGQKVTAALRSSEEDPVTVGIAIDSSSSMTEAQLYTVRAAAELVRQAMRPQDEAFLVTFDIAPRLAHGRSRDAASLQAAVYDVVPAGATSMFDGVTFALQQFQGIPGKKALLVFSDGREGMSTASASECDRLARTLGVPVYVLVPPGGERLAHALKPISQVTGGRLIHATPVEELGSVYTQLADELRGQYVLSYARPAGVAPGTWRTIRVTVARPEARVRTIQGYRAQ